MDWTTSPEIIGIVFAFAVAICPALYALWRLFKRRPNDLLEVPATAYHALEENTYKAEQELADKYRLFVTEMLRLSSAGIAAFGFLLTGSLHSETSQYLGAIAVIMFSGSVVHSLLFLFSASEGLRYYIVGLRNYYRSPSSISGDIGEAERCLRARHEYIHVCRISKGLASLALALGGLFMAAAIFCALADKSHVTQQSCNQANNSPRYMLVSYGYRLT